MRPMMAITPICAHTLRARPIVVSSDDVVTIKPVDVECVAIADGRDAFEISPGDEAVIKKSAKNVIIMRTNPLGFYDILRLKMIGERKA